MLLTVVTVTVDGGRVHEETVNKSSIEKKENHAELHLVYKTSRITSMARSGH